MAKKLRAGPPKSQFKHVAHIPYNLKDKNIHTLELANEWQKYLLDGRKRGSSHESYAWAIWNTKYFWSKLDKKWKVRDLSRSLSGDAKQQILENLIILLRLVKMPQVKWGYEYVEELMKRVSDVIEGQKLAEATIKVKGTPEKKEEKEEEKEEEKKALLEEEVAVEEGEVTIVNEDTNEGIAGIDEPI